MAIQRTAQDWSVGSVVRVGFLRLLVIGGPEKVVGEQDRYRLESMDGTREYEFQPHCGLVRVR